MGLYTRAQLAVILAVVAVAGLGLGVGHWRRAHPELAARIERFDRAPTPFTPTVGDLPLAPSRRPRPDPVTPRSATPKATDPVDVNRATEDELRALPGIGAVLATRIVEARRRDGSTPWTTSAACAASDARRSRALPMP
jgi:hypothetical protein